MVYAAEFGHCTSNIISLCRSPKILAALAYPCCSKYRIYHSITKFPVTVSLSVLAI